MNIKFSMLITCCLILQISARCGHDSYLQYMDANVPRFRKYKQEQKRIREDALKYDFKKDDQTVYTIPVVVHVLYNTAVQNIDESVIINQIAILNQDYRLMNPDKTNVISQFAGDQADAGIQFILATTDTNNNPTNGINRVHTSVFSFPEPDDEDNFEDACKYTSKGGADPWDNSKYLNIWVCPSKGQILGYTIAAPGFHQDGVVISTPYFGVNPNFNQGPYNEGKTVVHEVGHWWTLDHPWGDEVDNPTCNLDDGVSDTPKTDGPSYDCNLTETSCGQLTMVQNYMDYAPDACMCMMTHGQVARMRSNLPGGTTASRFMAFVYSGNVPGIGDGLTTGLPDTTTQNSPISPNNQENQAIVTNIISISFIMLMISMIL